MMGVAGDDGDDGEYDVVVIIGLSVAMNEEMEKKSERNGLEKFGHLAALRRRASTSFPLPC